MTGMPNEQSFISHLLTIDEALEKLRMHGHEVQRHVVDIAWKTWQRTVAIDKAKQQGMATGRM
jgi:hypothetical protein